jgi:heptosyltransferase-2
VKILIVKLGAMGDVLRTTPFLRAYKRLHPGCSITWVVDAASAPVLASNPLIDRLVVHSAEALRAVARERYDLALNLDKEPEALDTIAAARAASKRGFGWDGRRKGIVPLNPASAYAVRLGLDDELKFRLNRKTYQEISFEQAEIPYRGEEYLLEIPAEDRRYAGRHLESLGAGPGAPLVGLNTGSGDRFAGKRLAVGQLAALAETLARRTGRPALLLGGPQERERNAEIEAAARGRARNAGTHHTITQFAALVERLGLVITGDTIAMHVAIAVRVPVLAFFGSTSAPEIELYGRGRKIASAIDCAPCYKRVCPIGEKCMADLSMERLADAALELLEPAAAGRRDRP